MACLCMSSRNRRTVITSLFNRRLAGRRHPLASNPNSAGPSCLLPRSFGQWCSSSLEMMHSNAFNLRPSFMASSSDHVGLSPNHPPIQAHELSTINSGYSQAQRQAQSYPAAVYNRQWTRNVQYPLNYYTHMYQLGPQINGYSAPAMPMAGLSMQGENINQNVSSIQGKNPRKRYFEVDNESNSTTSKDESNKRMAPIKFYTSSANPFPPQRQTPSTLYCELCRIKCSGKDAYEQHLAGARHKKAEQNESLTSQNSSFATGLKCDLCNIVCSGPDAYNAHIVGSKHSKAIKVAKSMGKEIPAAEPINISKKPAEINSTDTAETTAPEPATCGASEAIDLICSSQTQKTAEASSEPGVESKSETPLDLTSKSEDDKGDCEEQPLVIVETLVNETPAVLAIEHEAIGEDFIKEYPLGGKQSSFYCELCDCKMGDAVAKHQHVRGKRHRANHRRKIST